MHQEGRQADGRLAAVRVGPGASRPGHGPTGAGLDRRSPPAEFHHVDVHRQFEAVANAYQDTLLVPVVAFVEDNDGHKVVAVRSVAVRLWKKEQE